MKERKGGSFYEAPAVLSSLCSPDVDTIFMEVSGR